MKSTMIAMRQIPHRNPLRSRFWCKEKIFSGNRVVFFKSRLPPWTFKQQKMRINWSHPKKTLRDKKEYHRGLVNFYKMLKRK